MKSYQQLFAELKRRKVFKVAGVYGVLAFGMIQVADPLAGVLRLPETFLPFVVGLLVLGFPLALVLGSVLRNRMQWERSEAEYARALELDPEYPEAHLQYAQLLMDVGRLNEAIRMLERAVELDPIPISRKVLAAARLMGGQYEQALRELDRADPERTGRGNLEIWVDASAKLALGRYGDLLGLPTTFAETAHSSEQLDQALRAVRQRALASVPDALRGPVVLMSFGREDEAARRFLDDFRKDPRYNLGIHWMPLFDSIRDHPAYLEMLRLASLDGVTPDRPAAVAAAEGAAP